MANTLPYVGRVPDSDAIVVAKGYADSTNAAQALTTTYVNNQIASAAALLTTQTYADTGDSGLAHRTDVTAADGAYLAASALNAANGVAGLDSGGNLLTALIPASGVAVDRIMQSYCLAQPGTTRPTFDAVGPGAANGVASGSSVTVSATHTPVGTPSAALVWVQVCDISGTPADAHVVGTYGGRPMTKLASSIYADGYVNDNGLWVYGLISPPSGPQTVSFTVTTTVPTKFYVEIVSETFLGAGSFGPPAVRTATSTAMSVTSPSDTTQLLANCFVPVEVGGNLLTNYNKTARYWDVGAGGNYDEMIVGDAIGASPTVTFSTTNSVTAGWIGITVPLIPSPVASGNAIGVVDITGAYTATTGSSPQKLAHIVVPDPGYPWRPLPFALVLGDSSGSTHPVTRPVGTGSYGLLTVQPPGSSPQVYGLGICTGSFYPNFYPVLPHGAAGQTPTSVPPIVGGLELDLCGSLWSGTSYTFYPSDMQFSLLVAPAV